MKTALELASLYGRYLEDGWFPISFMEHLHEVCSDVGSTQVSGGEALDLGAHRGVVARRLAVAGARVIAIEANPYLIPTLKESLSDLQRVEVVNAAVVGHPAASISLNISRKYIELGSTIPNYIDVNFPQLMQDPDAGFETVAVDAVTLDEVIIEFGLNNLRFVKCDIEGMDYEALELSKLIWNRRPVICVENSNDEIHKRGFFEHFRRYNYLAFDCFMNELDDTTWFDPVVSPIDRFLVPAEISTRRLSAMIGAATGAWQRLNA
jgi:FkbM family methyltransferase